ncbi:unnamed protein product [Nezara viridula]|uniref:Neuropeptide n=1 Tax=Nezara viridula TaxID=85310 RepID=A0A9P0HB98_NEZVI|nr:unnamed protein product [Nezara viridula]
MFKLVVLPLLFAAVSAGIIGAPLAHGPALAIGHHPLVAAPVAVHTPLVATHASSYANTVRVVHNSVPVVRTVAAPVAVHAPVIAEPISLSHGSLLHGYHGFH